MKKSEIEKIENEIVKKYRRADQKTTKRMVVDGAGVKRLARLIKDKKP